MKNAHLFKILLRNFNFRTSINLVLFRLFCRVSCPCVSPPVVAVRLKLACSTSCTVTKTQISIVWINVLKIKVLKILRQISGLNILWVVFPLSSHPPSPTIMSVCTMTEAAIASYPHTEYISLEYTFWRIRIQKSMLTFYVYQLQSLNE